MRDTPEGLALTWCERLQGYSGERFVNAPDPQRRTTGSPLGIKACPTYVRLGGLTRSRYSPTDSGFLQSYGMNATGFCTRNGWELGLGGVTLPNWASGFLPQDVRLIRESDVVCPSDMAAIGDSTLLLGDTSGEFKFAGTGSIDPGGYRHLDPAISIELGIQANPAFPLSVFTAGWIHKRHGGHWNVVFCDNHVESPTTKGLYDYHSDAVLKRFNRDHLPHRDNVLGLP
jgi:prepilin-type processing-associated H-X9-DG protein